MQETLLHVCCAPCLANARATLRQTHPQTAGQARIFFYNPNIHPLLEFRRRIKALQLYLERDPLPTEIVTSYGLKQWLDTVPWNAAPRERCRHCYRLRLEETARRAASASLARFSTTLLASREQDRKTVAEIGNEAAEKYGLHFIDADLRRFLPDERMLRGIYKQQYCGCIFSEDERFRSTAKHLYFPGGGPEEDATPSTAQERKDT